VPGKLPRFPNDRGSARHVIDPQRVDFGIEAELVRIQGSFRVLGRCGVVVLWSRTSDVRSAQSRTQLKRVRCNEWPFPESGRLHNAVSNAAHSSGTQRE
jgi:hypothetical protein